MSIYKLVLHAPKGQEQMYENIAVVYRVRVEKHRTKNKATVYVGEASTNTLVEAMLGMVAENLLVSVKVKKVRNLT